jgi:uncharacterized protein involved in type VI secretion and phage assembly
MHPFVNAPHLLLELNRPKRMLDVLTCKGGETYNRPYSFQLEVVVPLGATLDAHELLFSPAFLHLKNAPSGIHGHIQSIVRSTTEFVFGDLSRVRPRHYLITLEPRLGLMAYRHNRRIFQDMTAQQIITQVLSEHGIDDTAYLWQRKQPCQVRDYCAQYSESDLQLVQRLCDEEKVHYHFEHTRNRHVVVFTDTPDIATSGVSLPPADGAADDTQGDLPRTMPQRSSVQRACVVGRLFEPASLDARGRLKVRFEWGNQGEGARFNECWIPVDPALKSVDHPWWGGMEVMVSFRDDNPEDPFITHRLWDPDINPLVHGAPASAPSRGITARVDRCAFLGDSQQFSIDDELTVQMAENNELQFRVGSSQVTLDNDTLTLSGSRVALSSLSDPESDGAGKGA